MLIGEKSIFAIECDIRNVNGGFVFCNFQFWIASEAIGNWREEAVLGTLIYSSKTFLRDRANRHLPQADSLSAEELWRYIDKFANSDVPTDLKKGLDERFRPRFLMHDIADDSVASVCEVMVAERKDSVQRLLWKFRGDARIQELTMPSLTVDTVIAGFVNWAETGFQSS